MILAHIHNYERRFVARFKTIFDLNQWPYMTSFCLFFYLTYSRKVKKKNQFKKAASSLPVQGTQVEPWSGKIPHATEQLSPCATTTEAQAPRACALQQEKPPQWEARTQQRRVAPARRN